MMMIRMIIGHKGSNVIQDFSLLPVAANHKLYLRPTTANDMNLGFQNCWTPRSR